MRRLSVLAAAAALAWAAPAAAQTYWHHPTIEVTSSVNKQTGLRDPGGADQRMYLYRFRRSGSTITGIEQKVWSGTSSTVAWPATWTARTEADVRGEGPFGSSLAAAAGEYWNTAYGLWMPRFQAFYDYRNATAPANEDASHRLGVPFWNWLNTAYNWQTLSPPINSAGGNLQPWSAFSWKNGANYRENVWGLAHDWTLGGLGNIVWYTSLREAWYDGASWRFTDHGRPRPDVVELIRMGPHSATWTEPMGVGRGYVFVSGNDGYDSHRLFVNYFGAGCSGTSTGWCWNDLGAPDGTVEMRTPVAMTYANGGGKRVAVFVTVKTGSQWNLWGRYTDDRVNFSNWQNFGHPPGMSYTSFSRSGFDMTAGVVYYQGGVQRINIFGTTEPYDTASSGASAHGGGELVEFYWDGAVWRWGMFTQPPGSHAWNVQDEDTQVTGPRFQTMSASVVDTQAWERIGVFGQDEFDRIWELYWSANGWAWQQH